MTTFSALNVACGLIVHHTLFGKCNRKFTGFDGQKPDTATFCAPWSNFTHLCIQLIVRLPNEIAPTQVHVIYVQVSIYVFN